MTPGAPVLMAVPNVSEGRDADAIAAIGAALAGTGVHLLDTHSDADHGRTVYTLAGRQGSLSAALLAGARAARERIDLTAHSGDHPHVGALDVAPVVYLDHERRGAACAEALTAAARVGDAGIPVFLYGILATDPRNIERADIRRGGPAGLARRTDIAPDFGPRTIAPRTGATLVAARPPLVAFNVDLATGDVDRARRIASEIRESAPGGLPGVRAIGLGVRGRAQVSTNVHDHTQTPLAAIVERVRQHAQIAEAELVGLAPLAAFDGFPGDVPLRAFDPRKHVVENALGSLFPHGSDEEEAPA